MARGIGRASKKLALCGMMTALGAALMLLGGLFPVATYVVPLAAGVLLLPARHEYGVMPAFLQWLATSLIVLALGVDREAAFFYFFLGYYPAIKPKLDAIAPRAVGYACKIGLFTLATGAMYALLYFVFRLDAIVEQMEDAGIWMAALFFVMLIACMLIYDAALAALAHWYRVRLRPKLKFLN
ncbi:MAG: hypothetical protein II727_02660 [Oscillospiraceae bacterium]|nr:hypothetical protein [Oscillospiraceae bacterium]